VGKNHPKSIIVLSIPVRDNLYLRIYTTEDAAMLFNVVNKARAHLEPWLNWVRETTREDHSLQFIEHALYKQEMQEELAMGIFLENELIGGIGMHGWDHDLRLAQLGYWIIPEQEGKGIISSCMAAFTNYLFTHLALEKLEIRFVTGNARSRRVAEYLGFRVEGIIRRAYLRNGLAEDLVVTGILRQEWTLTPVRKLTIT
jgi:ribosomal-protein-serine acetyltransferase